METRHERWERIRPALQDFVEKLLPIYGAALRSVILFGSYARGEEREDSDIDLLLLVDMTDEDLRKLRPPSEHAAAGTRCGHAFPGHPARRRTIAEVSGVEGRPSLLSEDCGRRGIAL